MDGFKKYREMCSRAARIRNWYLVNGEWKHLTQAEVRVAAKTISEGGSFRRATVEEELSLDGI